MKKKIELTRLRDVEFLHKITKENHRQFMHVIEFNPELDDVPKRTSEIPNTLIQQITDPWEAVGLKRAVGSIPPFYGKS